MTVSWYRCPCGFATEARPRFGDSITSVSHLHRATRLDGTSSIVRMDEISDPAFECEVACPVGSQGRPRLLAGAGARSLRPPGRRASRSRRQAA
jgi:hypothetical protein